MVRQWEEGVLGVEQVPIKLKFELMQIKFNC